MHAEKVLLGRLRCVGLVLVEILAIVVLVIFRQVLEGVRHRQVLDLILLLLCHFAIMMSAARHRDDTCLDHSRCGGLGVSWHFECRVDRALEGALVLNVAVDQLRDDCLILHVSLAS